ncbi:regulatory protein GntR HTH [Bacillus methanolicus MGA3]|uniref:Regulatory protein GntR HTH n=2 Tax=Bacillus methanolicus TaxID=1471 RepID=A0A068LTQ9_BACMM|nr:regulatory protein GntR HTH [Bacillus methanolicus MGA3]
MNRSHGNSKVYIEIVKQIRAMIESNGLKPGDKILSERELSERLNVGRSSVREALRALELLGLIETRRGEGTFICDFRGHQLVELLSTFILQDERAKRDVSETKHLIEIDCLRLILLKFDQEKLRNFSNWAKSAKFNDDDFFLKIVQLAQNYLFFRIWMILKDYYNFLGLNKYDAKKNDYLSLIDAIFSKNQDEILQAYRKLRKLSNP